MAVCPCAARPTPKPAMPCSHSGVLKTRSLPYFSPRPAVHRKTPPNATSADGSGGSACARARAGRAVARSRQGRRHAGSAPPARISRRVCPASADRSMRFGAGSAHAPSPKTHAVGSDSSTESIAALIAPTRFVRGAAGASAVAAAVCADAAEANSRRVERAAAAAARDIMVTTPPLTQPPTSLTQPQSKPPRVPTCLPAHWPQAQHWLAGQTPPPQPHAQPSPSERACGRARSRARRLPCRLHPLSQARPCPATAPCTGRGAAHGWGGTAPSRARCGTCNAVRRSALPAKKRARVEQWNPFESNGIHRWRRRS